MEERNAIIVGAKLGFDDHKILTAWLALDYGCSGQHFGGYALYLPESFKHHELKDGTAGHFIYRVLQIAGVDEWDQLVGKSIRVRHNHNKVEAIGHIIKDDWFCPRYDWEEVREGKDEE